MPLNSWWVVLEHILLIAWLLASGWAIYQVSFFCGTLLSTTPEKRWRNYSHLISLKAFSNESSWASAYDRNQLSYSSILHYGCSSTETTRAQFPLKWYALFRSRRVVYCLFFIVCQFYIRGLASELPTDEMLHVERKLTSFSHFLTRTILKPKKICMQCKNLLIIIWLRHHTFVSNMTHKQYIIQFTCMAYKTNMWPLRHCFFKSVMKEVFQWTFFYLVRDRYLYVQMIVSKYSL